MVRWVPSACGGSAVNVVGDRCCGAAPAGGEVRLDVWAVFCVQIGAFRKLLSSAVYCFVRILMGCSGREFLLVRVTCAAITAGRPGSEPSIAAVSTSRLDSLMATTT